MSFQGRHLVEVPALSYTAPVRRCGRPMCTVLAEEYRSAAGAQSRKGARLRGRQTGCTGTTAKECCIVRVHPLGVIDVCCTQSQDPSRRRVSWIQRRAHVGETSFQRWFYRSARARSVSVGAWHPAPPQWACFKISTVTSRFLSTSTSM